MTKFLHKHKNKITNIAGLVGGISWSILTAFQSFGIEMMPQVKVVLGVVGGACFGVIGYLTGKNKNENV